MRIGNAGQIFGISTVKSRPVSIPVLTHRPSVVADKDMMADPIVVFVAHNVLLCCTVVP